MIFKYTYSYKQKQSSFGNQPVAVAVNFAKDGRFVPIFFHYVAEDGLEYTYKIDGVKYSKNKKECIIFCCLFTNDEVQHQIFLTFYYQDCMWKLDA